MKKVVITTLMLFSISGCSQIMNTSFWDDNEAKAAVDVAFAVQELDCDSQFVKPQIRKIAYKLAYLETYATYKKSRDIIELTGLVGKTVEGLSAKQVINPTYCRIKKESLVKQTGDIASAVLGRF